MGPGRSRPPTQTRRRPRARPPSYRRVRGADGWSAWIVCNRARGRGGPGGVMYILREGVVNPSDKARPGFRTTVPWSPRVVPRFRTARPFASVSRPRRSLGVGGRHARRPGGIKYNALVRDEAAPRRSCSVGTCTRRGFGPLRGRARARRPTRQRADDADHTRSGRLSSAISVADYCQLGNGWARAPRKVVPSCDKRWVGARNL